jgi:5-hydroxyisourate hydrolase-like protein (transthyretin family)
MRLLISVVTIFAILVVSSSCLSDRLTTGKTPPVISNGSISGHVYESDGRTPVAGVNIEVWVAERDNIWTPVGTLVTDANGKYTIGGLRNGGYRLMASATGYRREENPDGITCSVVSGETTSVNFKMQALCSISGRVFDEATKMGIANAMVCAGGSANYVVDGCLNATTAADGSYKIVDLNPGYAILKIMADGYVPRYYGGVYNWRDAATVTTRFGENTPDINIGLEKGGSISGRVYRVDGITPAAMVNVIWQQVLENAIDVETPDPRVGFVISGPSVLTNEEGNYIIGGLLTGKYLLIAQADQEASYCSTKVSVKIGELTPGADMKLTMCGSLSGYVYKSAAKIPVGQGEVYIHAYMDKSGDYDDFYPGSQGMTNNNGSYSIEKLPPGQYTISVDVFRGGLGPLAKQYTVKITSGKNTTLDIIVPAY